MRRHELTDVPWKLMAPVIPRLGRTSKLGDRDFVNAVVFLLTASRPATRRPGETPWR